MLKFVCFFTALLFLNTDVHGKTDCIQHSSEGCEYCVQQPSWSKNCIWCELDNKCHATGSISPFNPCNKKQVIKNAVNCPNQTVLGEYSSQTAYNLLRLSAITYINNRKDAKQCLESQELYDFEIVEWIGRHCEELPLITYKECLAVVMISHDRRAIVLAYRGTKQLKQLIDEVQSVLLTSKSSIGIGSGEVQRYFKQAHDKLYGCVKASIHDQIQNYPEYDILITGHSLGGAIASIASARLVKEGVINTEKIALYTFGMPKVGDRQYAIEHNRLVNNSWRVVHRNDPVPHVPTSIVLPNGSYHHRTEVYYPSEVMLPTDTNYVICSGSGNNNCGSKLFIADFRDHKQYFNISIGNYCKTVVGGNRRSVKSAMWNHFSNNTCKRIKNPDFPTNRALLYAGNVHTTMLLILFKCLLFN
ncbi:unnamed protein product [Mytilus edulis]|uniref:Fungal lipase-type domain-containing protein n=1 Tax=Mytilus edulis TaxID=6550 RepID=A0A8S3PX23_MYTED|nr:unnamed protein product [Mytilus edulis]